MAKNAQEIENLKKSIFEFMNANQGAGYDSEMARIPLHKGDTVTLTGETELQKSTTPGVPDWLAFKTVEGHVIGLRQLFRRGNGIKYPENAKTPRDAANCLIDKVCSFDNGLALKIKEVRKVDSSTREGKNTYILFEEFDMSK